VFVGECRCHREAVLGTGRRRLTECQPEPLPQDFQYVEGPVDVARGEGRGLRPVGLPVEELGERAEVLRNDRAAGARIDAAYAEFTAAGLDRPTMFEFPHYAGSATDYAVVADKVGPRYDRGMYFPGLLSGASVDHSRQIGQFFPYAVRDVYGSPVVPENLGNVAVAEYNHHTSRLPADILKSARRNLVVRDGVASFFFHPFLDIKHLRQIVEGMQSMGYTFVPASTVLPS